MTQQQAVSPAELYQQFFGPALFEPWAAVLVDRAAPQPGERVLDLACGTGIVTRRVAQAVGPGGSVVGVDLSPGMLEVARRLPVSGGGPVEWREGDAGALPLPDGAFDLALCQQGFQFFGDRAAAAREMRRVLTGPGRAVVSVWQGPERHPLLEASNAAVARHLGVPAADLSTPFSFGDGGALRRLLADAGFARVEVSTLTMDASFPSAETFITMTTVAAAAVLPAYAHVVADPASRDALIAVSTDATGDLLERYRDGDGLTFPWTANIAVAHVHETDARGDLPTAGPLMAGSLGGHGHPHRRQR